MTIHKLRDEAGNVIHACATASFPLPDNHWIYSEPVEPEFYLDLPDGEQANIEEKTWNALKYAIQICTNRGKDSDFDPDAMLMAFRNTLFGIGRNCGPSEQAKVTIMKDVEEITSLRQRIDQLEREKRGIGPDDQYA